MFLDRFGAKLTYFLSITFWSLFTLLQAFAAALTSLLLLRFGLGISEAPCFPANSRIVATWFPQQERARATGIYTVGEYLGLALFSPLLFWIMAAVELARAVHRGRRGRSHLRRDLVGPLRRTA